MIQNTLVRVIILMENLFLYKTTMFFNIVITMQLIAPGYPVSMGLIFFVALVEGKVFLKKYHHFEEHIPVRFELKKIQFALI